MNPTGVRSRSVCADPGAWDWSGSERYRCLGVFVELKRQVNSAPPKKGDVLDGGFLNVTIDFYLRDTDLLSWSAAS